MIKPDTQSDQRQSYRCPVVESQQPAELRVGRRRISVRLYNESSGGFGALTLENPGLNADDLAQLLTSAGQFTVRVAFVREVAGEGHEESVGSYFRMGLQRVGDIEPVAAGLGHGAKRHLRKLWVAGLSVVVCLVIAAGGIGTLAVLGKLNAPWIAALLGDANEQRLGPVHDATLAVVIREVGLTRVQQVQLQEVAAQTARALQEIDELWKNDSPQDREVKQALLMEAAKREVTKMLTADQRARWKRFVN
jgi:hypothetical protein